MLIAPWIILNLSAFIPPAYADLLEVALAKAAPNANAKVIALAVRASQCIRAQGTAPAQRLAVIDYSLPSTEQRLWVFDLKQGKLLFHELVTGWHRTGPGQPPATGQSTTPQAG
nr:murein L,D-transpeptidase catalytic domain family protein [Pseudomonas alkylphenolica]